MKIQTMSLVTPAGCNAKCPYCVGRMTTQINNDSSFSSGLCGIYIQNLLKGIQLAKISGVASVIITGKGEPTLFPLYVEDYIRYCDKQFPFIELQTNGILFADSEHEIWHSLKKWKEMGLTHVAVSIAHNDPALNKKIFGTGYNLDVLIERLHDIGLTVRINCIMVKYYIDNLVAVQGLIDWAKRNKVDQLTIRPVAVPDSSVDTATSDWTQDHLMSNDDTKHINQYIKQYGTRILRLPHGAEVFDVFGQNVCITDCLTYDENPDELRQIIFMPNGNLRYSWQHEGAILLR